MRRAGIPLFLFTIATATSLHAQGGPPVLTDDPWTPRPSHWEINTGWEMERGDDEVVHALPEVDLNYGWGSKVQLKLEAPYVLLHTEGVGTRSGLGNPLAGVKFRFEDNFHGFAMSVYPQLQIPRSHATAANIGTSTHWALLAPVEIARSIGKLDLGMEGGYWFGDPSERETMGGIVAGYEFSAGFEAVAECNAEGARIFHPAELICGGGLRKDVSEHVALMGAFEPVVGGNEVDRADSRLYVGVQSHIRGGGLWKGRKRQPPQTEIH